MHRPPTGTLFSSGPLFSLPEAGCGLTVGNFDGVHAGHRVIVSRLRELAEQLGLPAVGVTFDPHPAALLRPEGPPPPLMTVRQRVEALLRIGLDAVVVLDTTPTLLALTAAAFYEEVLRGCLRAAAIVEGANFHFGVGRQGTVEQLQDWTSRDNLGFDVVPPVVVAGEPVSSSRIRQLLVEGDVVAAGELLAAPYVVSGTVVHGQKRGGSIGFPTANLSGMHTLLPQDGVYAGMATTATGQRFAAAIHIGRNLTFAATVPTVEVHLIGFNGDLYGQTLDVRFAHRLRATQQFPGVEALTLQLQQDVAAASTAMAALISATVTGERRTLTVTRISG